MISSLFTFCFLTYEAMQQVYFILRLHSWNRTTAFVTWQRGTCCEPRWGRGRTSARRSGRWWTQESWSAMNSSSGWWKRISTNRNAKTDFCSTDFQGLSDKPSKYTISFFLFLPSIRILFHLVVAAPISWLLSFFSYCYFSFVRV